jgi:hypothetical protein
VGILRRVPATLAALLLGAHFLRAGDVALLTACLLLAVLPFLPWRAATWIARLGLATGAVSWVLTALQIAASRRAAGAPYERMAWILGSVAAFTALAAVILPAPGAPGRRRGGETAHFPTGSASPGTEP